MDAEKDSDFEDCGNTHMKGWSDSTISDNEIKSCEKKIFSDSICDSLNDVVPPSNLKFEEETKVFSKKVKKIESALSKSTINLKKLRKLAISEGGLVSDRLRKVAWPLLLELKDIDDTGAPTEEELLSHPEYQQVVLDVNRSLKRFPPGIPLEQRLALQNQLTLLILQVVTAHPKLHYYQGYHDVAVTLLLVTGKEAAYHILEKLSTNHLKECMEPTMEKTFQLLNYIYPLIKYQNYDVFEHLEKSGVGTMFALPWFLTWFSHSLNQYKNVVRLYDYFLASEPLTPLYLCAVIVLHRSKEILDTPCDMANLHCLLSQIPDELPFEKLLLKTRKLYKNYPPEYIGKEVEERLRKEHEQRNRETALRRRHLNQNLPIVWRVISHFDPDRRLPIWAIGNTRHIPHHFSRYRYLVATATLAVGIYAFYMKAVEAASVWDIRYS